jgi:predicted GTPase
MAMRMTESLKSMVQDNKKVFFTHYKDASLWYRTEGGFQFPVPIEDIGAATFLAEDKAVYFMRYIRKHLSLISEEKAAMTDES